MPRITAPPLSAAINEFLQWLELDRHASAGTVAEYRADMKRFATYANKHGFDDAPVSDHLDRDLVRAYQRAIARARTHAGGQPRPLAPSHRRRAHAASSRCARSCASRPARNG
jgi:site-specific recombinase XerD